MCGGSGLGFASSGYESDMTDTTFLSQQPSTEPDQDAEPPSTGVPGPIHPEDPAEGPEE